MLPPRDLWPNLVGRKVFELTLQNKPQKNHKPKLESLLQNIYKQHWPKLGSHAHSYEWQSKRQMHQTVLRLSFVSLTKMHTARQKGVLPFLDIQCTAPPHSWIGFHLRETQACHSSSSPSSDLPYMKPNRHMAHCYTRPATTQASILPMTYNCTHPCDRFKTMQNIAIATLQPHEWHSQVVLTTE
jgi:hypothetical protein